MKTEEIIKKVKAITHGAGGSLVSDIDQVVSKAANYTPAKLADELHKVAHGHGGGISHTIHHLVGEIRKSEPKKETAEKAKAPKATAEKAKAPKATAKK